VSGEKDADARLEALLEEFGAVLKKAMARFQPRGLGIPADELEQEARIRLWRVLRAERAITAPASYLMRVAATVVIDAVRRTKARRETPLDAVEEADSVGELLAGEEASPHHLAERAEARRKVRAALDRLEANRRRVVGLYLAGYGSQEVADLLGWTEPRARNLLYRGLEDLRRELRTLGIEPINERGQS
jgi:RNA polymerase sigma factor (sigma-70 family)